MLASAAVCAVLTGGDFCPAQGAGGRLGASANGTLDIADTPAQTTEVEEPAAPAVPAPAETPVETPVDAAAAQPSSSQPDAESHDASNQPSPASNERESRRVGAQNPEAMSRDDRPLDDGGAGTPSGGQWLRTGVALAVVLGLIYLLSKLLKRWSTGGKAGSAGLVEVLARTPVTHRHGVLLVRVASKVLVVGVSPENLSSLSEISDPKEVAGIIGAVQSGRRDSLSRSFAAALDEKQMEVELEEQALEKMDLEAPDPAGRTTTSAALDRLESLLGRVRDLGSSRGGDKPSTGEDR